MGALSFQELLAKKASEIDAKKSKGVDSIKPLEANIAIESSLPGAQMTAPEALVLSGMNLASTGSSPTPSNKAEAVYVCDAKTYGNPCEVCAALRAVANSLDDAGADHIYKECMAKQTYLVNALVLTGPATDRKKVQILALTGKVFEEQILKGLCEEYGDISDPNTGRDIIINRTGSGFDTTYTVMPVDKEKSLPKVPKSILENLHDLDSIVAAEINEFSRKEALTVTAKMGGLELGTGKAVSTIGLDTAVAGEFSDGSDIDLDEDVFVGGSDEDDLDSMLSEDIDEVVAEVEAEAKTKPADADEDDLDALLAELES